MVIGFIGLGNMAKAIISGVTAGGVAAPEEIIGSDYSEAAAAAAAGALGIRTAETNNEVVRSADVIVLAVKPGVLAGVIAGIRGEDLGGKLFISIAAGKSIAYIEEQFAEKAASLHLIRYMPNTPALVQAGCTAVCPNANATKEELETALRIAESFGIAEVLNESLIDTESAVASCSPAYVFMFIEAMADAGVKGGLPRQQAYRFAAQAVMGSAKLVLETGKHPGELKDMVTSPGGTTIEGLEVLEQDGFRGAVMDAIGAAIDKAKEL